MELLEKELEDIVFNTSNEKLIIKGLSISGKKYRQVRLYNYGIADIITFEKKYIPRIGDHVLNIAIWELKKNQINASTLMQATRYKVGLERIIEEKVGKVGLLMSKFDIVNFEINLIGTSIDTSSDFVYLCEFIEPLQIYVAEYDIDGISFKNKYGYQLNNEGFPNGSI